MAAFIIIGLIQQQNAQRSLQRQRVFRDRTRVLDNLDDRNLMSRYRFPRYIILQLTDLVRDDVQRPTLRSHPIPAYIQVCNIELLLAQFKFKYLARKYLVKNSIYLPNENLLTGE
ncbi:hypothetical protein CHS0354_007706, partial [Potamilus streckersoni]